MAEHAGRAFVHLAGAAATAVEIAATGGRVCDQPPVRFCRPASTSPVPDRNRDALRRFLSGPDDPAFAPVKARRAAAL